MLKERVAALENTVQSQLKTIDQQKEELARRDDLIRRIQQMLFGQKRERFEQPIATEILAVGDSFHPAEEYHQDYYLKNPLRYRYYRFSCGRDQRLGEIWGEEAGG